MRYIISALAVATVMTSMAQPADAHRRKGCYEDRHGVSRCGSTAGARAYRSQGETADRIRANSYDPTGSYSAYPDWARYALSPKGMR